MKRQIKYSAVHAWVMRVTVAIIMLTAVSMSQLSAAKSDSLKTERRSQYLFDDGSVYTGQKKLGKPSGAGYTEYVNGDYHEGTYLKDLRENEGIYRYANGDLFTNS